MLTCLCGVGYSSLDSLLAGRLPVSTSLLLLLLGLKLLLSSFSLASDLVGGVFAPSLFFGAVAGTAYHEAVVAALGMSVDLSNSLWGAEVAQHLSEMVVIANAPAYATVGAAATLGTIRCM